VQRPDRQPIERRTVAVGIRFLDDEFGDERLSLGRRHSDPDAEGPR
jgi:hypothetical protein